MTNFILLIGAGLFTKAINAFQENSCVFRFHAFCSHVESPLIAFCSSFNKLLGVDADDAGGTGPGSYDVRGNVWHLDCCSPEGTLAGQGWTIFNAIFGWTNNATGMQCLPILFARCNTHELIFALVVGSVLAYVFYWVAAIAVLVWMKFKEVRFFLTFPF